MNKRTKNTLVRIGAIFAALILVVTVSVISRNTALRASEETADAEVIEAGEEVPAYEPPVEPAPVAMESEVATVTVEVTEAEVEEQPVEEEQPVVEEQPAEVEPATVEAEQPTEEEQPDEAEPTPEPEATEEPEATATPEPTEEPEPVALNVEVWFEYGTPVNLGDTITAHASVDNLIEGLPVYYQWYYSLDNVNWVLIEGATESSYKFVLSETNCSYYWRVEVNQ